MTKSPQKKLSLSRETLQRLSDEALSQPLGGVNRQQTEYLTYTCNMTRTCLNCTA
jgi:hypothetical protein